MTSKTSESHIESLLLPMMATQRVNHIRAPCTYQPAAVLPLCSLGEYQGLRWIKLSQIYPHSILGFIHIPFRSCLLIMYSVHRPTT